MVCVINPHNKPEEYLRSPMQTTARKVLRKYNTIHKQFSQLRSALPSKPSSDLQTVLQAILYIRDMQRTLQG